VRLIIEKIEGEVFAYREDEDHFKVVEEQRDTPRVDPEALDFECDLSLYDDFHMVFRVKKGAGNGNK
jgi:hypothetical protein